LGWVAASGLWGVRFKLIWWDGGVGDCSTSVLWFLGSRVILMLWCGFDSEGEVWGEIGVGVSVGG
jgi:hypothetical protein